MRWGAQSRVILTQLLTQSFLTTGRKAKEGLAVNSPWQQPTDYCLHDTPAKEAGLGSNRSHLIQRGAESTV